MSARGDDDPHDDDDGGVQQRLQRVGVKRKAAEELPRVKRERNAESETDSDSYVNNNKIAMRRVERNKMARAGAAAATAAPRPASRPTGASRALASAAATSPGGSRAHSRMVPRQDTTGHNMVPVLRVPDFLTQGSLTVEVLAEIERLYEPGYWDRDMTTENPALYMHDKEENERIALAQQGAFENPLAFKVISEMLRRHPVTQMDAATMGTELAYLTTIEPISRAYEESMLRKPRIGETACCNGMGCQCMEWFGFVMVEFLTPLEVAKVARGEPRSVINGMCLLCRRKMATYMRCMAITTGATNSQNHIYQLHRNIVNKPGEYTYEFSLPIGTNSPYPIMQNVYRCYKHVKEPNGHEYLRQDGYPRCGENDNTRPIFSNGTPQPKTGAAAAASQADPRPRSARPARQ